MNIKEAYIKYGYNQASKIKKAKENLNLAQKLIDRWVCMQKLDDNELKIYNTNGGDFGSDSLTIFSERPNPLRKNEKITEFPNDPLYCEVDCVMKLQDQLLGEDYHNTQYSTKLSKKIKNGLHNRTITEREYKNYLADPLWGNMARNFKGGNLERFNEAYETLDESTKAELKKTMKTKKQELGFAELRQKWLKE